jgi:hypothetical protein
MDIFIPAKDKPVSEWLVAGLNVAEKPSLLVIPDAENDVVYRAITGVAHAFVRGCYPTYTYPKNDSIYTQRPTTTDAPYLRRKNDNPSTHLA